MMKLGIAGGKEPMINCTGGINGRNVQRCGQIRQIMQGMSASLSSTTIETFAPVLEHYCVGEMGNRYRVYALDYKRGGTLQTMGSISQQDHGDIPQATPAIHILSNYKFYYTGS